MSKKQYSFTLPIVNNDEALNLFGSNEKNLKLLEKELNVDITSRGDKVIVNATTDIAHLLEDVLKQALDAIKSGNDVNERDLMYLVNSIKENEEVSFTELNSNTIAKTIHGKAIKPKTVGQMKYLEAIKNYDLVFGVGPAGTGKTYLAVIYGVKLLKENKVKKIILTRPAVEAGESLGFLPGDMKDKVDPYLRPLYDALNDMLGAETVSKLMERGTIEVAPLAYMRGRTLDNAYVILDEAQNATDIQMKMFLTRLGFDSKMIVTGDISQVDLPRGKSSGLRNVIKLLKNVKGISIITLNEMDVVRHPLVQKIIRAYDNQKK